MEQVFEEKLGLPVLETTRLILRPFAQADAKLVQKLAGTKEVTSVTANIPYPYPDGLAESWIANHQGEYAKKNYLTLAITLQNTGELVGCMTLMGLSSKNKSAEIAYWVAVPHWGKGICTEAGRAVLDFAIPKFQLNKITARHLAINPASGKVMQKLGMKQEGLLRQDNLKDGVFHDMVVYGMLRSEYNPKQTVAQS